ncbi:MAG: transglutaminase domain-containing protein [Clostridiaceae bacterium]|nr:transglutaminase domain-containing protein [Clostridiaceae bacterium]
MTVKKRPLLRTGLSIGLCLAVLLLSGLTAGCLAGWPYDYISDRPALSSETTESAPAWTGSQTGTATSGLASGSAASPAVPTNAAATAGETTAGCIPADPTRLDACFDEQATQLLLQGLLQRKDEIKLDQAFAAYQIDEDHVQDAISQVFNLYQTVCRQHPEYFYLDGSAEVQYTLVQGLNSRIKAMSLKLDYWADLAGLSQAQLTQLSGQVDQEAEKIAAQIRQKTIEPWEQLSLLHDLLIRRIAYDPDASQTHNRVDSALLQHVSLCQGYAQTYQLIGQKLGYDVRLISGEVDGEGHAWNLVYLNGVFYHVDVTYDDPIPDGGADSPLRHCHLFRSDAQMAATHQWDPSQYPACPSDGVFYFTGNHLTVSGRDELVEKLDDFLDNTDFSDNRTHRLELLYTGSDSPDQEQLEKILSDALQKYAGSKPIYYRVDSKKSVVLMDVSTQA